MKYIEQYIRTKDKYTEYQVQQIMYLVKTCTSECSKILIMLILFRNHLPEYITALVTLLCLRSFAGGIHFDTYIGCLLATISYFGLAIIILPALTVSFHTRLVFFIICMILSAYVPPVTSKYRPPLSTPKRILCQTTTTTIIFICILFTLIFPYSPLTIVNFWTVTLHVLQLLFAKI